MNSQPGLVASRAILCLLLLCWYNNISCLLRVERCFLAEDCVLCSGVFLSGVLDRMELSGSWSFVGYLYQKSPLDDVVFVFIEAEFLVRKRRLSEFAGLVVVPGAQQNRSVSLLEAVHCTALCCGG